jgi:hypothetical protein
MSNNGDAEPIAYERDFTLSVGSIITTTTTMTATITQVSTPILNTTGKLDFATEIGYAANLRSDNYEYYFVQFADYNYYSSFSGNASPSNINERTD